METENLEEMPDRSFPQKTRRYDCDKQLNRPGCRIWNGHQQGFNYYKYGNEFDLPLMSKRDGQRIFVAGSGLWRKSIEIAKVGDITQKY